MSIYFHHRSRSLSTKIQIFIWYKGVSEVCGFAVQGNFCAVFRFSQNFEAVFRFPAFLRFAVSSIFVRFFGFCCIFVRFLSKFRAVFDDGSSNYELIRSPPRGYSDQIRPNTTKYDQIRPNPTESDVIRLNPTEYDVIRLEHFSSRN